MLYCCCYGFAFAWIQYSQHVQDKFTEFDGKNLYKYLKCSQDMRFLEVIRRSHLQKYGNLWISFKIFGQVSNFEMISPERKYEQLRTRQTNCDLSEAINLGNSPFTQSWFGSVCLKIQPDSIDVEKKYIFTVVVLIVFPLNDSVTFHVIVKFVLGMEYGSSILFGWLGKQDENTTMKSPTFNYLFFLISYRF